MARPITKRVVKRLQLDLSPHAMSELKRLMEEREAASYSEVIKQALKLFTRVHDEMKSRGQVLGLCDPTDQSFTEIIIV